MLPCGVNVHARSQLVELETVKDCFSFLIYYTSNNQLVNQSINYINSNDKVHITKTAVSKKYELKETSTRYAQYTPQMPTRLNCRVSSAVVVS